MSRLRAADEVVYTPEAIILPDDVDGHMLEASAYVGGEYQRD